MKKSFAGIVVDTDISFDYSHPDYSTLKEEYEEEMRYYNSSSTKLERQEYIIIDGKKFEVNYGWSFDNRVTVYIDNETLFTTEVKEVYLDSGEKVWFYSDITGRKETNLVALKNAVEANRIRRLREFKKHEYESLKVNTINDIVTNVDKLGKIRLTMNNGGYGDTPILIYGCILLKKNTVKFSIVDDEEFSNSNTLEALQYLFIKEVEKRYGQNMFSHQTGKKKKVLTESEKEIKKDFDSLVREVLLSLTVENAIENLEFLEEYYQDLMK